MEPWLLPSPHDEGSEEGSDEDGDEDEGGNDDEGDVPWAGEGYQRAEPPRPTGEIWIGVLPSNAVVVRTFQRCQPQISLGMGVLWQGVSASEVRAACLLTRVARADWMRVLDGVQLMARVVADMRNEESAKKSKKK